MSKNSKMNRVAILATLGAEVHRLGIGYDDRDAWRGVLEMSLDDFSSLLAKIDEVADLTVGEVLARIVTSDPGALGGLGHVRLFERQAEAYRADCASWAAQPDTVKIGSWRNRPPTRGQRFLMIRMSQSLGVALPGEINRGEAEAWIAAYGGNPRFKEGI